MNTFLRLLRPAIAVAIVLSAFPSAAPVAQTADTARYKTYVELLFSR